MKRIILILLGIIAIHAAAFAYGGTVIPYSELPEKAREFIQENFPGIEILQTQRDRDIYDRDYKVNFSNGTVIEFDRKGDWTEIKSANGIPDSVVPAVILNFIRTNHASYVKVIEIERDAKEYELKLDNGLELEFDNKGNFRKYKD
ncbi:MAG: PepSY-like domain-containing protein [Rikenellaceae bacterium]|nr:PepSY-like domain-containing protein [Rikenellaceae bacterium]